MTDGSFVNSKSLWKPSSASAKKHVVLARKVAVERRGAVFDLLCDLADGHVAVALRNE
jgi:hypothetical protein